MKQINFNNHREDMTPEDKTEIFMLLAKGLRQKNRDLLCLRLTSHLFMIPYHGILERLMKEPHGWTYYAGQDYPSEIRMVRDIILKCK